MLPFSMSPSRCYRFRSLMFPYSMLTALPNLPATWTGLTWLSSRFEKVFPMPRLASTSLLISKVVKSDPKIYHVWVQIIDSLSALKWFIFPCLEWFTLSPAISTQSNIISLDELIVVQTKSYPDNGSHSPQHEKPSTQLDMLVQH